MEGIIAALITGGLSLAGVIITNVIGSIKTSQKIEIAQAVTVEKIKELTYEVRMHNNFAEKIPVIQEQICVANHRIADLEEERKASQ